MVDLAALVLFLRWICRCVVHLQKTIVEDEAVRSSGRAVAWFTDLVPAPGTLWLANCYFALAVRRASREGIGNGGSVIALESPEKIALELARLGRL